jgi:hypothetical protein
VNAPSPYVEPPDIPAGMTVAEYRRARYVVTLELRDPRDAGVLRRLLARRCFRNVQVRRES